MVVQSTRALISYNDGNITHRDRDFAIAKQLATYLRQSGIDAQIKEYSASDMSTDMYQWLILIYSPEIMKSTHMTTVVDIAIDQAIQRRLRGVVAITTSASDLPSRWATIRKFDASDPKEENTALTGLLNAMHYAKIRYPEAVNLAQQQAKQQSHTSVPSHRRETRPKKRTLALVAVAVCVILLGLIGEMLYFGLPGILSGNTAFAPSTLTATAPTSDMARQIEYNTITSKSPTITGFQSRNEWLTDQTQTMCFFDGKKNYHALISSHNHYQRCMAKHTANFTNFALQVTMRIKGDAGGVIFRSNDTQGTYYRFAFDQSNPISPDSDIYSVYLCQSDCFQVNTNDGTKLFSGSVSVSRADPIMLTVIAQDNNIDLYFNGMFLHLVSDTKTLSGEIGVYAASFSYPTDVTFSNLKVWSLDRT